MSGIIVQNPERAERVLAFMAALPMTEGRERGQPWVLDEFQKAWIRDIYSPAWDEDGKRVTATSISTLR